MVRSGWYLLIMVEIVKPARPPKLQGSSDLASSIGFGVSPYGPGRQRQQYQILKNLSSIRDNIRNILFFRKGDYYDDPDFGVGFQDFVFDPNDEALRLAMDQEIRRQIRKYEERVRITTLFIFEPQWIEHAAVVDLIVDVAGQRLNALGDTRGSFDLFVKENG